MIPSEIRDRIREGIGPALLERGFRGRSSTFSRPVGDVFQLLQLQAASDNSSSGAHFTVNVAVWAPSLSSEQTASVDNAHWLARLGSLGPDGSDIWWQADDTSMADDAARDIIRRIDELAIPALDELKSTRDLLRLWKSGHSPGLTRVQADRFRRRLEELARGA